MRDYQSALMRGAPPWVREECARLYWRSRTRRAYGRRNRWLLKATAPLHMTDAYTVYRRDTPIG